MKTSTRLSLLERVQVTQAGRSWGEFVAVYDELVAGWLRGQGISAEDCEDIRQDVLSTVTQQIVRFEHNGRIGAFRNWLRKITCHRMHRLWDQRKSRPELLDSANLGELADQLADDRSRTTLIWNAEHDRIVLRRLLQMLHGRFSENSLAAFQRVVLQEEPASAVAEELGMSLGAVRVAQHRVLQTLKTLAKGMVD